MNKYWYVPLLALFTICSCSKKEVPVDKLRPVIVATVRNSAGIERSVYSGEVRARYETDLGFRVGGKIIERNINLGDLVRKGQLLAKLDPQDQQLSASAAQAQVDAARAQFNLGKADYTRAQALFAQHFISSSALDTRRSQWQAARAQLDQARARQRSSFNQVTYTQLRADRDGVVTALPSEVGQVVAAGQKIVGLADPSQREVLIWVPESRVAGVRVGQAALVQIWGMKDKTYAGRVRELAASADPVTRTYAVRVAVPDADEAFRLGTTAVVGLQETTPSGQIQIPLTAVVRDAVGQSQVWVVERGGIVAARLVTLISYQDDTAVVQGGLNFGDQVVAVGAHVLKAGMHVRAVERLAPVALDVTR